jgi:hypothetical protein
VISKVILPLSEVRSCAASPLPKNQQRGVNDYPDEEHEPEGDAFWVGSTPVPSDWIQAFAAQDPPAVGAYNTLREWCLPLISIVTRQRRLLIDLVARDQLRAAVAPLAAVHGTADFLLTLLLIPLDEPLNFIHAPSRRAFSLIMDCVPNNFTLHTLLASALANALGHAPPPPEVLRCIAGEGPGSCEVPSKGTWNLYTWKAAAQPLEHLNKAPLEDWVWHEGRPADIPHLDRVRVVLAGENRIERSWNTLRTFDTLPVGVRLERELSEPESRKLLERTQTAARL